MNRSLAFGAALLVLPGAALAAPLRTIPVAVDEPEPPLVVKGVEVSFGGFIKLDALFSRFSDGDVPSLDQGRDYFRPASIPVAASAAAEDPHAFLDLHAKDTRFFLKTKSQLAGHTLGGHLEMDFRSAPNAANETVTNAYTPRLMRAFLTWDRWLLGQEWSLMRNLDTAPDHIDDIRGPVEALVVVRQPTLRWTDGPWQLALENSETAVQPREGTASGATPVRSIFVTGDSTVPDLAARYTLKTESAIYTAALVLRQLAADGAATGGDAPDNLADGTAFGYGVNLSGKLPAFGADDLRFALSAGEGNGRYVALGTIPDAVVGADNGLEPIPVVAGYVAYRHPWSARWRSTLTLAALSADLDEALSGPQATAAVNSVHANLLYAPVDKLTLGAEVMHAVREIGSGEDGALDRLQVSARFDF